MQQFLINVAVQFSLIDNHCKYGHALLRKLLKETGNKSFKVSFRERIQKWTSLAPFLWIANPIRLYFTISQVKIQMTCPI